MTVATITEKGKNVLEAIQKTEKATVPSIAKYLGVNSGSIMATMAPLKKGGSLVIEDGILKLTDIGLEQLGASTKEQNLNAATPSTIAQPSQAVSRTNSELNEGKDEAIARTPAGPRADSKASKAQIIFDEFRNEKRSVLMQKMMDEAGLTKNGANTYIYNLRKKAGIVTPRGVVVAASAPPAAVVPETPEDVQIQEEVVTNLETVADMPAPIDQIEPLITEEPTTDAVIETEPLQELNLDTVAEAWKIEDETEQATASIEEHKDEATE